MIALNNQRKYWDVSPNPGSALNQAHWEDPEVRSVDRRESTEEMEEVDVFCICCLECMISIINLHFLHWPSEGVILWCTWWIEGLSKLEEVIANAATLQPLWVASRCSQLIIAAYSSGKRQECDVTAYGSTHVLQNS